jgi:hypothetical protein
MNFIKLKGRKIINEYQIKDLVITYGVKIKYSRVSTTEKLIEIIPERYRDQFVLLAMDIVGSIPPHTDSGIKCTINVYVSPGNYTTKFWSIKDHNPDKTYQVKNQTNGKVFSYDAVEFINSFKAKKGEIYLLDVTKPHSVESIKPNKRFALCIQTSKFSFEEVKNMLIESGYI